MLLLFFKKITLTKKKASTPYKFYANIVKFKAKPKLCLGFFSCLLFYSTGLRDKYACFTRLAVAHKQHFVFKTLEHFLKTYSRVDHYPSSYGLSVSPSVKWNLFFMAVHGVTYQFSPFSDAVVLLFLRAGSTSLTLSTK